jgi:hypothetical protein
MGKAGIAKLVYDEAKGCTIEQSWFDSREGKEIK